LEKKRNTPLVFITGILLLLFVIPLVLAVITLAIYGELAAPEPLSGLASELDANFALALLVTALPLLVVWVAETQRRRSGGKRSARGTLVLLVLLMAAVTAVPAVSLWRPLAGLPTGQALAILAVAALPLLAVLLAAAILLPETRNRKAG
jgi:membrane protease YdiL (CAAX protease family)